MGFFDVFKSKKIGSEAERREFLRSKGRITDGRIIDSETSDAGKIIVHYY